eukprot:3157499-Amphidinium_carterae.1
MATVFVLVATLGLCKLACIHNLCRHCLQATPASLRPKHLLPTHDPVTRAHTHTGRDIDPGPFPTLIQNLTWTFSELGTKLVQLMRTKMLEPVPDVGIKLYTCHCVYQ